MNASLHSKASPHSSTCLKTKRHTSADGSATTWSRTVGLYKKQRIIPAAYTIQSHLIKNKQVIKKQQRVKKPQVVRKQLLDYLGILFGCLIVSVAFVFFINPYRLVPGGVFGTSIVLHSLFPAIQVGTFSYFIAIPLLLIAYCLLGKGIGVKTLVATFVTPLFMNILSMLAYPDAVALRELDPSQLAGGQIDLSRDLILATIMGGVLVGVGEGIIVRSRATSGGSDIVGLILSKYLHIKFSWALMMTDMTVVMFGLVVIGLGLGSQTDTPHSWMLSCYSVICIYIISKTISFVVSGSKNNKLIFIVTHTNYEQMQDFILNRLDRTATVIPSQGLYSATNQHTLMLVVRRQEVDTVTKTVAEIDPDVFVIVTDSYDIYGYRWKDFPDKADLQLN